jgi:RecA-family ATPase
VSAKLPRLQANVDRFDPTPIVPADEAQHSAPAWHSRIVSVGEDWYTTAPPAREWLLRDARTNEQRGWLPVGKAGVLIAEGGAGKTMALVQLAIAVAKGGAWFGTFPVEKSGKVFMLLGEEEADEAQRRIYTGHAGVGTPPVNGSIEILPLAGEECAFLSTDEYGRTIETAFVHDLRDYLVKTGPWALIVAEPLSRVGGPDAETDNAAATRLVQVFESIVKLTGATVLGAHHTNKPGRGGVAVTASASRGSSALIDGFRWAASLAARKTEALGEVVTMEVVKSNYSFKGEPLLLRRADNGRLEPITGEQQAQVEADIGGETARKERLSQREAEREATLTARETAEAARRSKRANEAAEARASRDAADLRAVQEILATAPTLSGRELRTTVKARLGCGSDRADAAILRATGVGGAE